MVAYNTNALSLFLTMLEDDSDPLVQMSILDLLEKLATTTTNPTTTMSNHKNHHTESLLEANINNNNNTNNNNNNQSYSLFSLQERANWLLSKTLLDPLLFMAGGFRGVDDDDDNTGQDDNNNGGVNKDDNNEEKEKEDNEPDPILGGPALRVVVALCKLFVGAIQRLLRNFTSLR